LAPLLASDADRQRAWVIIMATIVFGNGIEPGGMELQDEHFEENCPACTYERARYRMWESAESGAINQHSSIRCPACGYTLPYDEER